MFKCSKLKQLIVKHSYVSPLYDLTQITNFADDNFYIEWNKNLAVLINDLEMRLEMITKWLKDSGLTVNEGKTEICLFHRNDKPTILVNVCGTLVRSKKQMNVLGVIFDNKLNWNAHISHIIKKAKKSLYALKLLKRHFNHDEMRMLLDSYFYSVLYYNSVIWLTPEISSKMKHNLFSISANALRTCLLTNALDISFDNIHKNNKKCTPNQIMLYQISIKLFKVVNDTEIPIKTETIRVFDQVISTRRQLYFEILRNNTYKIGMNTTTNKFYHVNKRIGLNNLNLNFVHFKKIMKIQFLKNGKT